MPAFEGLFPPPHDVIVQDLLFVLASWHGVAKLRMHTESTLDTLDDLTQTFGSLVRRFARVTCKAFVTVELPKEAAARVRRTATKKSNATTSQVLPATSNPRVTKKLNLSTYKLHAMGDYSSTIRKFGTVDSYSTQAVCTHAFSSPHFTFTNNLQGELEHKTVKRRYPRVSKSATAAGISKLDRRETHMRSINANVQGGKTSHPLHTDDEAKLPFTDPKDHHHISREKRYPDDIGVMLMKYEGDPALKVS